MRSVHSISIHRWNPLLLNPVIWLDGQDASTITLNGSTVSSWVNKGSWSGSFAQATVSAQPTYGTTTGVQGNVLGFNGSQFLLSNAAVTAFSKMTIFVTVQVNSLATIQRFIGSREGSADSFMLQTAGVTSSPFYGYYYDDSSLDDSSYALTTISGSSWYVVCFVIDPALTNAVKAYNKAIDVTSSGSNNGSGGVGVATGTWGIGSGSGGFGKITGHIGDVFACNSVLSSNDIINVSAYLSRNRGI